MLPVLAVESARTREPMAALRRLLRVLEAIGSRSAYFALLLHDDQPRRRLVELAAHGDFLTDQIAAYPLLLDELIGERILEQLPDRAELAADLAQRMAGADQDDEEQLLERLCRFQRAALFRFAVADLIGRLPVMQVSDRLTDLAELIVERVLGLAWQHLTRDPRYADVRRSAGAPTGAHRSDRLRQARRHGARLRLRPGPGVRA